MVSTAAIIGLVIIVIMFGSTFAYAILQSVKQPSNSQQQSNVIGYAIPPDIRSKLITGGATVITLDYNLMCENCLDQKYFLESVANEFKNQVVLEEIIDNSVTLPKLVIESNFGYKNFTNATAEDIFKGLCDLMSAPPVTCVAR